MFRLLLLMRIKFCNQEHLRNVDHFPQKRNLIKGENSYGKFISLL